MKFYNYIEFNRSYIKILNIILFMKMLVYRSYTYFNKTGKNVFIIYLLYFILYTSNNLIIVLFIIKIFNNV